MNTPYQMISFPSIKQFRDVVRHVKRKAGFAGLDDNGDPIYNPVAKMPTLHFKGSVKLHGTNAAIVTCCNAISLQSRERVLTEDEDNAGFYAHMSQNQFGTCHELLKRVCSTFSKDLSSTIAVFGEWCGGKIQNSVAITGLPKMFVVFAVKIDDEWQDIDLLTIKDLPSVYSIKDFPQYEITIDFNAPEMSQNELGQLTGQVEKQCPVGLAMGNDGIGEGIVWRCLEDKTSELWFKVKGEKHSASKVKTLAAVDVEALQKVSDFVASTVTESRLEQGLQNLVNEQLKPFEMTSLGDFIRWVYNDILKEESDTIELNEFDPKKLGGPIANAAKRWYIEKLNNL